MGDSLEAVADPGEAALHWPPPEVASFIESEQERAFRRLALQQGLGADPDAAYRRLVRPLRPIEHLSSHDHPPELDAEMRRVLSAYGRLQSPSRFEDPTRYLSIAITFDSVVEQLDIDGTQLQPRPYFASAPAESVDARIVVHPATGTPVIFFESGLFSYFHDFAKLVAWAVPPLSPEQLMVDAELARIPRRYTMPPHASEFFIGALSSYALGAETPRIPTPEHNRWLAAALLTDMERFIMAHELTHLTAGHLEAVPAFTFAPLALLSS